MTASTSKTKVYNNNKHTSQRTGIPCQTYNLLQTAQHHHNQTEISPPPKDKTITPSPFNFKKIV